jgi:hypothetical protein
MLADALRLSLVFRFRELKIPPFFFFSSGSGLPTRFMDPKDVESVILPEDDVRLNVPGEVKPTAGGDLNDEGGPDWLSLRFDVELLRFDCDELIELDRPIVLSGMLFERLGVGE